MSDDGISDRIPAETWPPGEFIREELEARGWTARDLGIDPDMPVDEDMAKRLGAAFGTSPEYWLNLQNRRQSAPRLETGDQIGEAR
jgi:HTH-type transcriptional regulator/antitoxin HigA